jgi:hypothetical protein
MGLADLHTHTIYSYDGTASVPAVLNRARQKEWNSIRILRSWAANYVGSAFTRITNAA